VRSRRLRCAVLQTHDTLALAASVSPASATTLDALCERFGVDNAGRKLHGALLDAQLIAEVYLAMTRGQESLTIDIAARWRRGEARIVHGRRGRACPRGAGAERGGAGRARRYLEALDRESKGHCIWRALGMPLPERRTVQAASRRRVSKATRAASAARPRTSRRARRASLINRELSLLDFNRRVLALAERNDVPLLDAGAVPVHRRQQPRRVLRDPRRGPARGVASEDPPPGMTLHEVRADYARIADTPAHSSPTSTGC